VQATIIACSRKPLVACLSAALMQCYFAGGHLSWWMAMYGTFWLVGAVTTHRVPHLRSIPA
jgi:hypothetical protein